MLQQLCGSWVSHTLIKWTAWFSECLRTGTRSLRLVTVTRSVDLSSQTRWSGINISCCCRLSRRWGVGWGSVNGGGGVSPRWRWIGISTYFPQNWIWRKATKWDEALSHHSSYWSLPLFRGGWGEGIWRQEVQVPLLTHLHYDSYNAICAISCVVGLRNDLLPWIKGERKIHRHKFWLWAVIIWF